MLHRSHRLNIKYSINISIFKEIMSHDTKRYCLNFDASFFDFINLFLGFSETMPRSGDRKHQLPHSVVHEGDNAKISIGAFMVIAPGRFCSGNVIRVYFDIHFIIIHGPSRKLEDYFWISARHFNTSSYNFYFLHKVRYSQMVCSGRAGGRSPLSTHSHIQARICGQSVIGD